MGVKGHTLFSKRAVRMALKEFGMRIGPEALVKFDEAMMGALTVAAQKAKMDKRVTVKPRDFEEEEK